MTDERRLALFPARTVARDPNHGESPIRREQDLIEPAQNLSLGFVELSRAVVITTTSRRQKLIGCVYLFSLQNSTEQFF